MTKSSSLVFTALVGMCAVTGARATSTIEYNIANTGGAATGSGYSDLDYFTGTIDGAAINSALVGGIQIKEVSSPTVAGFPANYVTVCTDINASVYLGQTYGYNAPTSFLNPTILTGNAPSWGAINTPTYLNTHAVNVTEAIQAMQNAAWIFYNEGGTQLNTTGITSLSVNQMAGLQLAIWETLYDSTGNNATVVVNSSSRFSATSFVNTTVPNAPVNDTEQLDAAADIAALNAALGHTFDDTLGTITGSLLYPNPDNTQGNGDGELVQELLLANGAAPQGSPVPEPGTIMSGLMVLLPAGATTLRMLRKKTAV